MVLHLIRNDYEWQKPDWNREVPRRFWDPGRKLILTIRKYQRFQKSNNLLCKLIQKIIVLEYIFWSVITGADIPLNIEIEGGLLIPHPNGIVIHPDSKIGPNCLIFQQVTIAGEVKIGYHVDIGAGAKIIGPLNIGDNVIIGANTVVTRDIQPGETVVGVPAHPI